MIQVIVKRYDYTVCKYEFDDAEAIDVICQLENLKEGAAETERPQKLQEQSQELKDELVNLLNILAEVLRIDKLLDWMQKKLERKG